MKITKEGIAVIEGDTHISKWIEQSGRLDFDQNMLPRIINYIKPGDVIIDAGAFIGDHTIAYCKAVGTKGMVIAIEPNRVAFECLQYNLAEVKCKKLLINLLVSESVLDYKLIQQANVGATYGTKGGSLGSTTIDLLRLGKCDFIKLDIEGFEINALIGAKETIKKYRPTMVIEVNSGALKRQGFTTQDLFDLLNGFGYSYTNIYVSQPMEGPQYDILCLSK